MNKAGVEDFMPETIIEPEGLHAPSSFFLVYTWNSYRTERNMETFSDEKLFKNTALHDMT